MRLKAAIPVLFTFCVSLAVGQVVFESFKNSTATDWIVSGTNYTPTLTSGSTDASGDGWLRLTSTGNNQATAAYYNNAFVSKGASVYASFEFQSWGGSGADGIVFFLYDGSKVFNVGADGGSIGYAQKTGVNGLNGGYLGVAVDEFGNFSSATEGRSGGMGFQPDAFAVRGPGQGTTGYEFLGGSGTLATSIDTAARLATPNKVDVYLSPTNQLTVSLTQPNSTSQTVLSLDLSGYDRPDTLKMGFSSGTGGSTNYHEVRNINLTAITANKWDNGAGTSKWGTATNWNPDAVPLAGADILFDNTYVSTAQTIDTETNRTVRSLYFDAPFSYTINNNTLVFNNGGTAGFSGINVSDTHGTGNHIINSALSLQNSIEVKQGSSGTLSLNGNVGLGANNISFTGVGNTTVAGAISGTGAVAKFDAGTLSLNAANTYSGGTVVNGGTVSTNNNSGFGTGSITLSGGAGLTSTASNTLSNNVSLTGNGSLTNITTAGTLTNYGANTLAMSGATQSGAVNLSNDNTGRTLTVDVTGTSTISGAIGNGGTTAGNLTKSGAGTLVLSGNNTYTGTTTISQGTVQLGASNRLADTSSVNLASGTLNLNTFSERVGTLSYSSGGTLDFGSQTGANYFLFSNVGTSSGVLSIQNWQSGTDILGSSSTLTQAQLDSMYFVGYGAGATHLTGTTVSGYGTTVWNPIAFNSSVGWTTWDSGNGTNRWSRGTNWNPDLANNSTTVNSSTARVQFGTGNQTTVDLEAARTVNAMRFDTGAASFNIGGGLAYTLTFDSGSTNGVAFIQQASSNNQSITVGTVALAKNTVVDMIGTGSLTISSALSGSGDLVKENTGGTLILSGASSSYAGNVLVNAGTLEIQSASALGNTTGTTTVATGATLRGAGTFTSAENINIAGTGVAGVGAIQASSGALTLSGTTTLSDDSTVGAASGATLNLTGSITGAHTLTFTGAGTTTASLVNTGAGSVIVNTTGTTTFNGAAANTYTGTTYVNGGTLSLSKTAGVNAIAGDLEIGGTSAGVVTFAASNQIADTSRVTVNGNGTFNLGSRAETIAALDGSTGGAVTLSGGSLTVSSVSNSNYAGSFSGTGSLNKSGAGKMTLSGSSASFSGGVNVSAGILSVAGGTNTLGTGAVAITSTGNLELQGNSTLGNAISLFSSGTGAGDGGIQSVSGNNTLSGNITVAGASRIQADSGTLTTSGTMALGANALTIGGGGNTTVSGAVTGTGAITKEGTGTLTLSNTSNTATGTIAVAGGTLGLGNSNVIANGASVALGSAGTFDLNGFSETISTLSGTGSLLMDGGTLTLNGASTFAGSILGSGNLNVANSLTFGSAITDSSLTLNLAGTLNLGAFNQTVGTLNLTGNSILDFGGTGAARLNLSNLNLNGFTLTINNWTDAIDYFYTQAFTGAVLDARGVAPENQITFAGFSNNATSWRSFDKQITPVPEPSTYGAILLGLCCGAVWFYRRQGVSKEK